jgi:hypothetical protein
MRKYNNLRKKIDKMSKAVKGSIAPYIAYLDKIQNGYELRICFWDGKEGSADKMPKPIISYFSNYEKAEKALIEYLEQNNPLKPFVLFSNEELIYE